MPTPCSLHCCPAKAENVFCESCSARYCSVVCQEHDVDHHEHACSFVEGFPFGRKKYPQMTQAMLDAALMNKSSMSSYIVIPQWGTVYSTGPSATTSTLDGLVDYLKGSYPINPMNTSNGRIVDIAYNGMRLFAKVSPGDAWYQVQVHFKGDDFQAFIVDLSQKPLGSKGLLDLVYLTRGSSTPRVVPIKKTAPPKDNKKNKKTSAKDAAKEMHERIMSLLTEAHNSPASAASAGIPGVYCVDPTFGNVSKFFGTTATTTAELIAYLVKEEKNGKTRSDVFETIIYNLPPPGVMSYAQGTNRLFIEFGRSGNMAVVPHMANGRFLTFIVVENKPQPGERLTQLF